MKRRVPRPLVLAKTADPDAPGFVSGSGYGLPIRAPGLGADDAAAGMQTLMKPVDIDRLFAIVDEHCASERCA